MATVLAVDKDPLQLELLSFLLRQEGHRVHATPSPETALDMLQSTLIDLVIIETVLPRQDGVRVCQQIRQLNPYMPVMILSERGDEEQIVRGLMVAADDYVLKPYSPRQVLARVHALLRRANLNRGGRWQDENLAIGEITLNLQQMHAIVNGRRVALSPRELSLLHALMENSGRVLSRDQLMRVAWGNDHVSTLKNVDVHIQRIKKKLQPHLSGGSYIEALRGFGYKFAIPRPQPAVLH
ncbi:MAG TPA: response regulator transcription factor [Candidatus Limnocylindrales bacterium]|nr:response regulator transcription factor [Candidatus Limnocylindrales bacterium]